MSVKGELKTHRDWIESPKDLNYRKLGGLNYSMIVKYDKSPADFVDEFILGNPRKDDSDTVATIIGNIVDDILFTHRGSVADFDSAFDDRYALYSGGEVGSGQVFQLADELFEISKREPDASFESRFLQAFETLQRRQKYKKKTLEYAMKDFEDNAVEYFQTKMENQGKIVVSVGLLGKSQRIAIEAMEHPFTKDLLNFDVGDEEFERLTKFPITFTYEEEGVGKIEGKCEVDMLDVDHKKKMIFPYDGKTTYDNTQFPYNYLKNSYYIQQAWYTKGIKAWAKDNGMEGYVIAPYEFIVADSAGWRWPLRYKLNDQHLMQGIAGFVIGGRVYKGISELVSDIIWSAESGNWGVRRSDFLKKGIINLPNF